ncbi:sodium/hydrogen exchanger [Actinorhabdospora filicis]|uniref:Sodium/hydrogen exchanger n=1 Tax=Actinorhabdospora filicis TaxID=1785913 RepID=A0A9W6STK3_9ACTN|nr:cation:proton antiporter [Actinorhabdospora filicis]GLZ81714.1 sodium/hydrogen exchanger [Actinorhabdospora filicis]
MDGISTDSAWFGLTLIFAAAVLAPLLSDRLNRWIPVPSTVLEIVLGILLGPVFLLVHENVVTGYFHDLGLAMLFFLAGYEIEFGRIKGRPLTLASAGWIIGIAAGLGLGTLVGGGWRAGVVIGIAVTTTALGTILPMVRDAGLLPTKVGAHIMAVGAIGEFAPMAAIVVFFGPTGGGDHPPWVRAAFVLLAVAAAFLAMRPRSERVGRLLTATLGTSVQFAVRLSMLMVVMMIWIAYELGLDIVLGGFVAGVVIRLLISTIEREEAERVASKLDAVGFGFLVPFFFVTTGVGYNLKALLDSPSALLALPLFLLLFLVVRGVVTWFVLRRDFGRAERLSLSLLASTQLPLVVVVAGIGADTGRISAATESSLVGAAMLSVLIFPLLAIRPGKAMKRFTADHLASEPT